MDGHPQQQSSEDAPPPDGLLDEGASSAAYASSTARTAARRGRGRPPKGKEGCVWRERGRTLLPSRNVGMPWPCLSPPLPHWHTERQDCNEHLNPSSAARSYSSTALAVSFSNPCSPEAIIYDPGKNCLRIALVDSLSDQDEGVFLLWRGCP
ncbi:hypothetical protein THAOC_21371, partial [Thalassiosira oceanica]